MYGMDEITTGSGAAAPDETPDVVRDQRLEIRLTAVEKAELEAASGVVRTSSWARFVLLEQARGGIRPAAAVHDYSGLLEVLGVRLDAHQQAILDALANMREGAVLKAPRNHGQTAMREKIAEFATLEPMRVDEAIAGTNDILGGSLSYDDPCTCSQSPCVCGMRKIAKALQPRDVENTGEMPDTGENRMSFDDLKRQFDVRETSDDDIDESDEDEWVGSAQRCPKCGKKAIETRETFEGHEWRCSADKGGCGKTGKVVQE